LLLALVTTATPSLAGLAQASGTPNPIACKNPTSQIAYPAGPHGLFELGAMGPLAGAIDQYALRNPLLCGVDVFVHWSSIDMGPSADPRYNWTAVDKEIAPWEAAGKEVALIVSGASEGGTSDQATPTYVMSHVTMVSCPAEPPVPVFWQPTYLDNWRAFLQATVAHFASDPHVAYLRFGMTVDGEGYLPGVHQLSPACADKWDAFNWSTNMPRYIQGLLAFEKTLHSPHAIVAALDYADMSAAGQQAAASGVGAGMEGLDKATATAILQHRPCPFWNWCSRYVPLAKKTTLYLQTLDNSNPSGVVHSNPPSNPELTGPLPPLLAAGVALHAQILEIFPADWLMALDPQYPGYAQYHALYLKALVTAAADLN